MKSAMIEMTAAELEGTCGGVANEGSPGSFIGQGVDLFIAGLKKIGQGLKALFGEVRAFFGW
ncbi:hypothetical protein [Lacunisphaera limnophila]|uniref:hypothetical protein n=1 Tax=Lacunisphaera limnophila TaxID=1838286 RepID=UPI0012FD9081|nr:hypothetical protein [Lacunisphaera limnophila]